MPPAKPFQIAQIVLVTICFIFHLYTFYDFGREFGGRNNMILIAGTVYGIYFVIVIGDLVAILAGEEFTPPMEATVKLFGAVLFGLLGVSALKIYLARFVQDSRASNYNFFGLIKGVCTVAISVIYYVECFQASSS